jgi:outer membrane protein OmpA-like peptidoglycan-associated protein
MNGLIYQVPGSTKTEVTLWFKSGSIYENDSVQGINNVIKNILTERIKSCLGKGYRELNEINCEFTSATEPEHTTFRLIVDESNLNSTFCLLRDSVFYATFRQTEIDSALANIVNQIGENEKLTETTLNNKVLQELFREDSKKLMVMGNPQKFRYIHLHSVNKYFERYYVASNSIISATGKLSVSAFDVSFSTTFSNLPPSEFDPETITKIIDFRPMIYSNQAVINDTSSFAEFKLYWQFPGTCSYQQGSHLAFLFEIMFNDKNNYLQVLSKKMGCKLLEAQYEPNNFSGVFCIRLQPESDKLISTLDWLNREINRINNTLANESMINAAKLIFRKQQEEERQTKRYADNLIRFWPYKESNYYTEMYDSVMDINEKEMRKFVAEFLVQSAHFTYLRINESERETLQVDSFFTDVTDTVRNYIFNYRPNITDLEGQDNMAMFSKLAQWLKANPDVNVLVNGFSDKSEYNKAYSDTIMKFIDSIPSFRKTMPDLVKKGYLQPEVMRSMKILKMLNDYGIALDRLAGTSMVASTGKNELENMKCSIVLTKMRKMISSKDYYRGTGFK